MSSLPVTRRNVAATVAFVYLTGFAVVATHAVLEYLDLRGTGDDPGGLLMMVLAAPTSFVLAPLANAGAGDGWWVFVGICVVGAAVNAALLWLVLRGRRAGRAAAVP